MTSLLNVRIGVPIRHWLSLFQWCYTTDHPLVGPVMPRRAGARRIYLLSNVLFFVPGGILLRLITSVQYRHLADLAGAGKGVEPSIPNGRRILNPLHIPILPPRQNERFWYGRSAIPLGGPVYRGVSARFPAYCSSVLPINLYI